MLMKLSPGVNFTNILGAAFACADPESAKRQLSLSSLHFWDLQTKKLLMER